MGNETKRRPVLCCVLLCLLLSLLPGCGKQEDIGLILSGDPEDRYAAAVQEALPEYGVQAPHGKRNLFAAVRDGNVMECFDIQALPAMDQDTRCYWYPQCLATVVIASDPDRVDTAPRSWGDLVRCGVPVGWNGGNSVGDRLLLGALSYGLSGETFDKKPALGLLRTLREQGQLRPNDRNAPVMVLLDCQAAAADGDGKKLTLAVPEEGTLTFSLGLLSAEPLRHIPSDGMLLSAGMRLPDGRRDSPAYPPEEDYAAAVPVGDADLFLKETGNVLRDMRRTVLHTRLYSSADDREHVLFALTVIIAVLLWMGSAIRRADRRSVQKYLWLIALQLVLWIGLRLIKYQLPGLCTAARYCWYGYYIFQIGLPLTLLALSASVCRPGDDPPLPRWFGWAALVSAALVALVFTNDLHMLVFRFALPGDWQDEYSYGPVYFLIYGWCALLFLFSLVQLIRRSARSSRRLGWILPLSAAAVILAYSVGYALDCSFMRDSDYAIVFCILVVLFMEAILHAGWVPTNTQYHRLFSLAPLKMQLLDQSGHTALASRSSAPLSPVLRIQLSAKPAVTISQTEDTVLFGHAVRGGTIVWEEDVRPINTLHRQLTDSVERLEAANALLSREAVVRRERLDTDSRAELFDSLLREIDERTEELGEAIDDMDTAPDKERHIAYITLLLCYIKRRCNLFFLARENAAMPAGEMAVYLDELSEFAGYTGIRAMVSCGEEENLDIRVATLYYDFFYTVLAWSVQQSRASLIGQIQRGRGDLEFWVLASESAESLRFSEPFLSRARELGGGVSFREIDDETGIYLTVPDRRDEQ